MADDEQVIARSVWRTIPKMGSILSFTTVVSKAIMMMMLLLIMRSTSKQWVVAVSRKEKPEPFDRIVLESEIQLPATSWTSTPRDSGPCRRRRPCRLLLVGATGFVRTSDRDAKSRKESRYEDEALGRRIPTNRHS